MVAIHGFFHVGVAVSNLAQAMETFSTAFGLTWSPVLETERPFCLSIGVVDVPVRLALSVEEPAIELFEGAVGTLWSAEGRGARLHHLGVWCDDAAEEIKRLQRLGMTVEMEDVGPEGVHPFTTAYLLSSIGLRFEVASAWSRPAWDAIRSGSFEQVLPAP